MRTIASILIALALLTSGRSLPLYAHEGHSHRILGTVTTAAADHVVLKDRDGKDITVKVTKDTKVKSKPALKVEHIKAGTRVVITATQEKDKSFTARSIDVGVGGK